MTLRRRVEGLEADRAAEQARPGMIHVHYEDGSKACPACESHGKPGRSDTVLTVRYTASEKGELWAVRT